MAQFYCINELINNLFIIINKDIVKMLKSFLICLVLVALTYTASVPCSIYQTSKFGNATDCSINRIDAKQLSWGVRISFSQTYNWKNASISNVIADMSSPRLPIPPSKSSCTTKAGSYNKGDSVLFNCTQAFDSIPTGYANVLTAFDG